MNKSAVFSSDRKYRYCLTRVWDESKPVAMCIGLNPSTANESAEDATISRLISALTALGYGGLHMLNLYALVSSKPKALSDCHDPVKDNDRYLEMYSKQSDVIIFCWGVFKEATWRAKKVKQMFPNAMCFGKSKQGNPWHPLAMMYAGQKGNEAALIKY